MADTGITDYVYYRSNIFNYESKLFDRVDPKNILDSLSKENSLIIDFHKETPENQLLSILNIKLQENSILESEEDDKEIQLSINRIDPSKISLAKNFLRTLLEILHNARKTEEDKTGKYGSSDNSSVLLYCLLYLDGLIMMDIEVVKNLNYYFTSVHLDFIKELNSIINSQSLNDQTREVASHIISAYLSFNNPLEFEFKEFTKLIHWTYEFTVTSKREHVLTSNYSLLLTFDNCCEYFTTSFEKENRVFAKIFDNIIKDQNINFIYENLFVIWNVTNNKNNTQIFADPKNRYLELIVQVIKSNKVDKIARIVLMIITNLYDNEAILENLLDIKFQRSIDILLSHKWSDNTIKDQLNSVYDYLDKNSKFTNSFEKYMKEIDSGILKPGVVHTNAFWEDNYKALEFNKFIYVEKLVKLLGADNVSSEMKELACFDVGEFARLYPGGVSILEDFNAKKILMGLVEQQNMDLKNKALICLQKLMVRSLKR